MGVHKNSLTCCLRDVSSPLGNGTQRAPQCTAHKHTMSIGMRICQLLTAIRLKIKQLVKMIANTHAKFELPILSTFLSIVNAFTVLDLH